MGLRRLLVIGGAIALTGLGDVARCTWCWRRTALTPLAVFMLALFVALFAWIALSFTSAIAGFVSLMGGGGRRLLAPGRSPLPTTRTALLMPTYNEIAARVMAGLQAIDESLRGRRAQPTRSTSSSSATPPIPTSGSPRRPPSWRCAQRTGGDDADLLSPPREEHRPQGRQHRRLGARGSAAPIRSS